MKKDLKLEFAPGAFDGFEGTQEELDELMAEIQKAFESGELLEIMEPVADDDPIWDVINAKNTKH